MDCRWKQILQHELSDLGYLIEADLKQTNASRQKTRCFPFFFLKKKQLIWHSLQVFPAITCQRTFLCDWIDKYGYFAHYVKLTILMRYGMEDTRVKTIVSCQ